MLRLASRLPEKDRGDALASIRKGFRGSAQESSEDKIKELLASAHSKISYLKMVTPQRKHNSSTEGDAGTASVKSSGGGSKRYVMQDGELVCVGEGEGDISDLRARGISNMDSGDIKRHQQMMRRFRFEDRPGGLPRGPFGR